MLEKLLREEQIILELEAKNKDGVIEELLKTLKLSPQKERLVLEALKKRESIGSTGIGKGIAIPHTRSLVIDQVYLAVGRSTKGINFDALDQKSVHLFFLLCAPPQDPGTVYLLTLGKIAHVARKLAKSKDYLDIKTTTQFMEYLLHLEETS